MSAAGDAQGLAVSALTALTPLGGGVQGSVFARPFADWDSSILSGIADGQPCYLLPDASGGGADMLALSGKAPLKQTYNGLPVLRFDGTKGMQCTTIGALEPRNATVKSPVTIALVVRPAASGSQPGLLSVLLRGSQQLTGRTPAMIALNNDATYHNGCVAVNCGATATSFTADTTNGSLALKNVSAYVVNGTAISGSGIPANTYIESYDPASGTAILSKFATATATTVSLTGTATDNYNNTNQYGPSLYDKSWHIIVVTSDGLTTQVYIDGYFNSNIRGDFLSNPLFTPLLGINYDGSALGFAGDLGEAAIWRSAATQNEVWSITQAMNAKWGCGILAFPATTVGSESFETGTTTDTSAIRIWSPTRPSSGKPVVAIFCHPQGMTSGITSTAANFIWPSIRAMRGLGWWVAASDLGYSGSPGGSASSWGNPTAQTALLQLVTLMDARVYAQTGQHPNIVMFGASMGGCCITNAIQLGTLSAFPVKGAYIIDGAVSLWAMYKTSYYNTIDAGYGCTAGTLSATANSGQPVVSSSVSYSPGTIVAIETGTANVELATVLSVTGSGPYSLTMTGNLAATHASGVRISDYGTKTAGYDPLKAPMTNFLSLPVRWNASTGDVTVIESANTDLFKAAITAAGGTAENSQRANRVGAHLGYGASDPRDVVEFFKRCGV